MSEAFPRDAVDSNSYKVICGGHSGHIFTDQTVVFNMETTCGHPDDQREFDQSLQLYICISDMVVSTDCVYLSS